MIWAQNVTIWEIGSAAHTYIYGMTSTTHHNVLPQYDHKRQNVTVAKIHLCYIMQIWHNTLRRRDKNNSAIMRPHPSIHCFMMRQCFITGITDKYFFSFNCNIWVTLRYKRPKKTTYINKVSPGSCSVVMKDRGAGSVSIDTFENTIDLNYVTGPQQV